MWGHNRRQMRESSPEINHTDTLILNFSALRTVSVVWAIQSMVSCYGNLSGWRHIGKEWWAWRFCQKQPRRGSHGGMNQPQRWRKLSALHVTSVQNWDKQGLGGNCSNAQLTGVPFLWEALLTHRSKLPAATLLSHDLPGCRLLAYGAHVTQDGPIRFSLVNSVLSENLPIRPGCSLE